MKKEDFAMDKYPRETSPRELTDEEIEAVSGGGGQVDVDSAHRHKVH
jgi:hypothetical protein